ncbi:biosynthetic peptidoglycan transglycosylase [Aurantimonas sp. E1-2-R+4]|uniref:biosynthetic peptidoglycan transglycosylase n=1 Tax=Aurantimonas sp. E1-2-R+4 TaxID=3113714 RepID=UPI003FA53257
MRDKKTIPSIRELLIRANLDVEKIVSASYIWDNATPLSDVEFYVTVLEDRRFYGHFGLDFPSLVREVLKSLVRGKSGGASTIDMQYVRTITGNYDRTLSRKFYEMALSVILRFHVDKTALLRSYLAQAYFGNRITGVDAAADVVFSKAAADLHGEEAAFIAAMLVYPRPKEPNKNWYERVRRRALYGIRVGARLEKRFKKIDVR